MQTFRYKATDVSGMTRTGVLNAESENEIINMLREKALRPVSIQQVEQTSTDLDQFALFKKKVKLVDISVFCRQLSAMLKAGMALDRAISTQILQTENKTLKESLTKVSSQVKQGNPLSKCFAEQPTIYPKLLVNMVEAGEITGDMDGALTRMATHFEKENKINRRIKGAMMYPIVLLTLTIVVAIALLVFVIPQFSGLFQAAGGGLPGLTQFVVNISDFIKGYWYILIIVLIAIVVGIKYWLKTTNGRFTFDSWKLKLPIVKKPMQQIVTARFTRTLSTMLSSGISLVHSMESAAETSNNVLVVKKIGEALEDLKQGAPLTMQLRKTELFPEMMLSMIGIGEETGEMDSMLSKTADYYDEEFDSAIGKLLSLLEPLLIIFMAGVIGFIVIAMYMPIFDLATTVM